MIFYNLKTCTKKERMKNFALILLFLAHIGSVFSQKEKLLPLKQLYTKKKYNRVYDAHKLDFSTPHPEVYRLNLLFDWDDTLIELNPEIFPNLQELRVGGDKIRFVPTRLREFKQLQVLYIGICSAEWCQHSTNSNIPDEIFELSHLKVLHISGHPALTFIPEKIGQLKELISLTISPNFSRPYFLPVSLAFLPQLKSIKIDMRFDRLNKCEGYSCSNIYNFNKMEMIHFYPMYYKHIGNLDEELKFITSTHTFFDTKKYYFEQEFIPLNSGKSNLKPVAAGKISRSYANGQKSITGEIDSLLRPIGNWMYYYQNGQLKEERFYKKGKETGQWSLYDSLRTLISHYQFTENDTTSVFYYYPDGKVIADYHFVHNKAEGKWHAYKPTGELIYEFNYSNDMLQGQSYYKTADNRIIYSNYLDGFRHGMETVHRDDGVSYQLYYIH